MSKTNKFITNRFLQLILFSILLISLTKTIEFIEEVYRSKSGFYKPNYWPPSDYIKGFISEIYLSFYHILLGL